MTIATKTHLPLKPRAITFSSLQSEERIRILLRHVQLKGMEVGDLKQILMALRNHFSR